MPNVTVSSLKKENDSLKAQIATLRHNFEILQQSIQRSDGQATSNGGESSPSVADAKASNSLTIVNQKQGAELVFIYKMTSNINFAKSAISQIQR